MKPYFVNDIGETAPEGFISSSHVLNKLIPTLFGDRADLPWMNLFGRNIGRRTLFERYERFGQVKLATEALFLALKCDDIASYVRAANNKPETVPFDTWYDADVEDYKETCLALQKGRITPSLPPAFAHIDNKIIYFKKSQIEEWLDKTRSPHLLPDPLIRDETRLLHYKDFDLPKNMKNNNGKKEIPTFSDLETENTTTENCNQLQQDQIVSVIDTTISLATVGSWLATGDGAFSAAMLQNQMQEREDDCDELEGDYHWDIATPSNNNALPTFIAIQAANQMRFDQVAVLLIDKITSGELNVYGRRVDTEENAGSFISVPRSIFNEGYGFDFRHNTITEKFSDPLDDHEGETEPQWDNVHFRREDIVSIWGDVAAVVEQKAEKFQKEIIFTKLEELVKNVYVEKFPQGHRPKGLYWEDARTAVNNKLKDHQESISLKTLQRVVKKVKALEKKN